MLFKCSIKSIALGALSVTGFSVPVISEGCERIENSISLLAAALFASWGDIFKVASVTEDLEDELLSYARDPAGVWSSA